MELVSTPLPLSQFKISDHPVVVLGVFQFTIMYFSHPSPFFCLFGNQMHKPPQLAPFDVEE